MDSAVVDSVFQWIAVALLGREHLPEPPWQEANFKLRSANAVTDLFTDNTTTNKKLLKSLPVQNPPCKNMSSAVLNVACILFIGHAGWILFAKTNVLSCQISLSYPWKQKWCQVKTKVLLSHWSDSWAATSWYFMGGKGLWLVVVPNNKTYFWTFRGGAIARSHESSQLQISCRTRLKLQNVKVS